jgi:glycosyltransferase involved in cell wall biosynthesis
MASKQHKLFWASSYDRGLNYLLFMWPDIIQMYPDAELHICYGWDAFLKFFSNNAERMSWKTSMDKLMNQKGITHHGRLGKKELAKVRKSCGIWAYPTNFQEINCITALDCQFDGVVPVTMDYGALQETVGAGIKVKGDIKDVNTQKEYLNALLKLMGNKKYWESLVKDGKKFAKDFTWDKIAGKWIEFFEKPIEKPLVSVITPTIREGWWRLMAENLAKQTYKNFEWIIIDDHKEDRAKLAKKYAVKYDLDIRYQRGDKVMGLYNRRCGLVRANNMGWEIADGELLVWLQDFILIPDNGIEQLVDVHRYNPDALIAPADIYYDVKAPDMGNKEDWWPNDPQMLGKESWRNARVQNAGIRESENPYDYEANYGAIPRKILEDLNGWWEFQDDGFGFDNTDIAFRALQRGYRIIVDDTNIAKCINLWQSIGNTPQNVVNRELIHNDPRYRWLVKQTMSGKLPLIRDEIIDESIHLLFEVPKGIKYEEAANWTKDNADEIVRGWGDYAIPKRETKKVHARKTS